MIETGKMRDWKMKDNKMLLENKTGKLQILAMYNSALY